MKNFLWPFVLAGAAACDAPPPGAETPRLAVDPRQEVKDDFEADNPKWTFASGKWERRAGVLVQTAETRPWAVALLEDKRFSDVDVSVRVRPLSGREDQTGGIVFRARDSRNYYLVRSNGLEDNVRLYTVIDGNRKQIASTRIAPPRAGTWHTLRVVARGTRIQACLDGKLLIDHEDATFAEGYVGLWTKADSVTEFDDFAASGAPAK